MLTKSEDAESPSCGPRRTRSYDVTSKSNWSSRVCTTRLGGRKQSSELDGLGDSSIGRAETGIHDLEAYDLGLQSGVQSPEISSRVGT